MKKQTGESLLLDIRDGKLNDVMFLHYYNNDNEEYKTKTWSNFSECCCGDMEASWNTSATSKNIVINQDGIFRKMKRYEYCLFNFEILIQEMDTGERNRNKPCEIMYAGDGEYLVELKITKKGKLYIPSIGYIQL